MLQTKLEEWAESTKQATIFMFSLHACLSDILDDPEEYDFSEEAVDEEGGEIWADELHPTTTVHEIIAKQLFVDLNEMSIDKQVPDSEK